jgi:very-short-patch-repair endonuclease
LKSPATGWVGCVDFGWPDREAVLECDGYTSNAPPDHFSVDRRRWSAINAAGWGLAVVTWFDVTEDPAYVIGLVRRLLGIESADQAERALLAS